MRRVGTRTRRSLNQLVHVPPNSTLGSLMDHFLLMLSCFGYHHWPLVTSGRIFKRKITPISWSCPRFHRWYAQSHGLSSEMAWRNHLRARLSILRHPKREKKKYATSPTSIFHLKKSTNDPWSCAEKLSHQDKLQKISAKTWLAVGGLFFFLTIDTVGDDSIDISMPSDQPEAHISRETFTTDLRFQNRLHVERSSVPREFPPYHARIIRQFVFENTNKFFVRSPQCHIAEEWSRPARHPLSILFFHWRVTDFAK